MKVIYTTDIPQIGDETCNKSLFQILQDVQPAHHLQGLSVKSVSYGYCSEYKCNALSLKMIWEKTGEEAGDFVYGVIHGGETTPIRLHNLQKSVIVNWNIRFYLIGLFNNDVIELKKAV